VEGREAKDRLYEAVASTAQAVASTAQAVASPKPIEVLELVETRKDATKVFYRLAGDEVAAFLAGLRDLARARVAEVDRVVRDYFTARDALEPVSRSELARLPKRAQVVAYCRGPYCVLAPLAVERLRAKGYQARRLAGGMPEWRLAGLPVAAGAE